MMNSAFLLVSYLTAFSVFTIVLLKGLTYTLETAGGAAAYFTVVSVGALLTVQIVLPNRAYYPYASWTMYSQRSPLRTTWTFRVVRQSGKEERMPVTRILPGPNARAILYQLATYARLIEATPQTRRATRIADLDEILQALVRLDARRSAADPIRQVAVQRCRLAGPPPWSRESFECTPILTRAVEPDGALHAP